MEKYLIINSSKAEKRAIEELKQYDDIVILNADKGNNTVVMDKLEYDKKLLGLLSDSATYQEISKNPIYYIEKRLNRFIESCTKMTRFPLICIKLYVAVIQFCQEYMDFRKFINPMFLFVLLFLSLVQLPTSLQNSLSKFLLP